MTEQPVWFTQLQHDLNDPVMVPDGAVIDWDRCRDLFLIPLLRRLEKRSSSPHPAIMCGLLERRLAGDDVTAELAAAAWAAAWAVAAAAATRPVAVWADAHGRRLYVGGATVADAAATRATRDAVAAERLAQASDLQTALAESTQPSALPPLIQDDAWADLPAPAMVRVTVTSGLCLTATNRPALPDGYIDDWFKGESPHALLVEAERKVELLKYALESIATYGSDTLSGRTDGPDDHVWQRNGVVEMTRRATEALALLNH